MMPKLKSKKRIRTRERWGETNIPNDFVSHVARTEFGEGGYRVITNKDEKIHLITQNPGEATYYVYWLTLLAEGKA